MLAALARGHPPPTAPPLATKVFAHTAAYDAAILGYFSGKRKQSPAAPRPSLSARQQLRYGENPHQRAAFYVTDEPRDGRAGQRHGKELSFNNLLDIDAGVGGRALDRDAPPAPSSSTRPPAASRSARDAAGRTRRRWRPTRHPLSGR